MSDPDGEFGRAPATDFLTSLIRQSKNGAVTIIFIPDSREARSLILYGARSMEVHLSRIAAQHSHILVFVHSCLCFTGKDLKVSRKRPFHRNYSFQDDEIRKEEKGRRSTADKKLQVASMKVHVF